MFKPRFRVSFALVGQRIRGSYINQLVVVFFALLTIGVPAARATNVGGVITGNTTWDLACSPWSVVNNVMVLDGVTLTIEPGVEVRFDAARALQINGELIAIGTSEDPILFTSNIGSSPGDWAYILFSDTAVDATYDLEGLYLSGSIIRHGIIEYAGGGSVSYNAALRIDSSAPFIDQSTIRYSASSGICTWGNGGGTKISSCFIHHNTSSEDGGGICAYETVEVIGCEIRDNSAHFSGGGLSILASSVIRDNIIVNNSAGVGGGGGGGIECLGAPTTITRNFIIGNSSASCAALDAGMYVTVTYNIIAENISSQDDGLYACSVLIRGSSAASYNSIVRNSNTVAEGTIGAVSCDYDCLLSHNTIVGNLAGENSTHAGIIFYNIYSPTCSNSNLWGNTGYAAYNKRDESSDPVVAENNWWGSSDGAEIEALIWDWVDDSSLGFVEYIPWLSAPDTEAPI
jgi:hypothetical protein